MATQTTATQTAERPRRRGPMSPEEMIDLRNQELQVDEEMVRQLVEEAKADFSENLLEPVQAATSPWAVIRHRRRLLRVMGGTAKLKTNGAAFLISVGLFVFFLSVMVYNPVYPWYFDVFAALMLTSALTVFTYVHGGYRQAFSRVYALERRDFTEPGYVTGWVRVYLPSLGFYYQPDVWRGNDGRNGRGQPRLHGGPGLRAWTPWSGPTTRRTPTGTPKSGARSPRARGSRTSAPPWTTSTCRPTSSPPHPPASSTGEPGAGTCCAPDRTTPPGRRGRSA